MVYGNGLENRRGETHREFESLPLRQDCMYIFPTVLLPGFYFLQLKDPTRALAM